MHPAYDKPLPEGWSGGGPVTKYWGGNYVHLYRVARPCATCGAEISLDVTKGALDGSKKNAGLLLRNCPKCRAERKAGGVGSRGGRSRPIAEAAAPVAAVDNTELEALRTANATMKEELEGLYAQIKELRQQLGQGAVAEPQSPSVRTYKLPSEPLTMAESTKALGAPKATAWPSDSLQMKVHDPIREELAQKWLKNNCKKMPWEG